MREYYRNTLELLRRQSFPAMLDNLSPMLATEVRRHAVTLPLHYRHSCHHAVALTVALLHLPLRRDVPL